jgi:hypothetical protein
MAQRRTQKKIFVLPNEKVKHYLKKVKYRDFLMIKLNLKFLMIKLNFLMFRDYRIDICPF